VFVESDVCPVAGECFSFAHAGADDQFVKIREWVVDLGAVFEEVRGLIGSPAEMFVVGMGVGPWRISRRCVVGGVVVRRR
jgi:hypothetical protein